jgi:DNA-binding transcriptional regulator YiaG
MKGPVSKRISKNEKMTVKELLEFMNKNGISSFELSEIFGVTPQCVNLWLGGERQLSVTNSRLIRLFIKYPKLLVEF